MSVSVEKGQIRLKKIDLLVPLSMGQDPNLDQYRNGVRRVPTNPLGLKMQKMTSVVKDIFHTENGDGGGGRDEEDNQEDCLEEGGTAAGHLLLKSGRLP